MRLVFFAGILVSVAMCFAATSADSVVSLDLSKLTLQDSDDYEVYSSRIALLEDSVKAYDDMLLSFADSAPDSLTPLAPKDSNESDEAFAERQAKYELEKARVDRQKEDVAKIMKRSGDMRAAINTIKKTQMGMLSSLLVRTTPENASVKISSQKQTLKSPAKFEQIIPGALTVNVELEGHVSQSLPLVLQARENREIDVALVSEASLAEAAQNAAKAESKQVAWRGYVRTSLLVAAAAFAGAGVYENWKASEIADDYNGLKIRTQKSRRDAEKTIDRRETLRNVFYGAAGAFAAAGVVTFFF